MIGGKDVLRYVVRIEVQAAAEDDEPSNVDDDQDYLNTINQIIEQMDDDQCDSVVEQIHQEKTFDLCPECFQQYVRNPLAAEPQVSVAFSEN